MKLYELTYLISPDLSEEEFKKFSEEINSFVQEKAGTLEKITKSYKKELGYTVKGKTNAFLITLNFHLEPEKLEDIEKKLKSENQILRYIILTKKEPEQILHPRRTSPGLTTKEVLLKRGESLRVPQKTAEAKKVELKEIDKKIEEILKE